MKKYLLPLAASLCWSTLASAIDSQFRLTPDDGQKFIYACNNPNISALVAEVREYKGDGWVQRDVDLEQKGSCISDPGRPVKIISQGTTSTGRSTYPVTEVTFAGNPHHLFVLRRNVVPISASEAQELKDRACGPGIYGEVDRVVEETDGTLKNKRFMVTSKCVNGRMLSTSKPLN